MVKTRLRGNRIRGVNADAGGRPDGNFHPKASIMTTLPDGGPDGGSTGAMSSATSFLNAMSFV
jgi:hypothetical protein